MTRSLAMHVRKVVMPVAGWGTRSLPATKNLPKEILPVFRKPAIQYIVEEAIASGLSDVVFVNQQSKRIIEDHFDHNLSLEQYLERTGKTALLEEVRRVAQMANVIVVRQKEQRGLGHAVACAREVIKDEPFAVMVGDDLMFHKTPGISQLLEAFHNEHMAVVGVMEVPRDKVSRYGIIDAEEYAPGLFRIRGVLEKPRIQDAPSRLAIVGRYVLTPEIFQCLDAAKPDAAGEIQLTDALQSLARQNRLLAVKLHGQRFDIGDWVDYLVANIYFALQDDELHDDLSARLRDFLPPVS